MILVWVLWTFTVAIIRFILLLTFVFDVSWSQVREGFDTSQRSQRRRIWIPHYNEQTCKHQFYSGAYCDLCVSFCTKPFFKRLCKKIWNIHDPDELNIWTNNYISSFSNWMSCHSNSLCFGLVSILMSDDAA